MSDTPNEAISVRDFSWRYEGARETSLSDVSLSVAPGECVVVIGRSGCGKSTLLYALNGLIPHLYDGAYAGEVTVAGVDALHADTYEMARQVGSVFQDPRGQFFTTNTTDEVAFGCENLGLPPAEIARRVDAAFASLGAQHLRNRSIFELSSGEKQRVAMASAVAMAPSVLVMDEPSANLDNEACAMLADVIGEVKRQGCTVVIAEHRVSYLMGVADRFVHMEKGRLTGAFTREEFAALDYGRACELGLRLPDLARVPMGAGARAEGAFTYEARGLGVAYGRDVVLDDVSFTCRAGEVVALIGRNGAGKTTLARTLAGLKQERAGAVLVDGEAFAAKERRAHTSFVMQDADYQLFCESVEAEVRFARQPTPELEGRIEEVLATLGLAPMRRAHPMTLSGGQKQRLTIACALTGDAPVVLFDEPTSGLDGGNMREVAALVRRLAAEGRHVMVVTHDFEFIAAACDRALEVRDGRIASAFPVAQRNRARLLACLGLGVRPDGGDAHNEKDERGSNMTEEADAQTTRGQGRRPDPIGQILAYAGDRRWLVGVGCALSAASMLASFGTFICIWLVARDLIAVAPNWSHAMGIAAYGWWALGFAVASIALYFLGLAATHLAAFRCASNMRTAAIDHLMDVSLGYFDTHSSGSLRRAVDGCAAQTENLIAHKLPDTAGSVAMLVGMLALFLFFDWRLGLSCVLSLAVAIAAMAWMMASRGLDFMRRYQDALVRMSSSGTEYVRGIPVVKVFQQTVFSFKAFHDAIVDFSRLARENAVQNCENQQALLLTAVSGIAIFLVPAMLVIAPGESDLAAFLANFVFYAIFSAVIPTAITRVMYISEASQTAADALARIKGVLAAPVIAAPENPQVPLDNSVCFEHVGFAYDGADEPALDDVSFEVPAGATVALVGPSGGGKSTAASLVPRFWDVGSGRVLVGGVDVREMNPDELMRRVAFVFQSNRLFSQSILENVRAARPEASREEVMASLESAQCQDNIEKLPQGIDTVYGAEGVHLSGGEAQRLMLARAILKDAPIVVLDEATAFADAENEVKIQRALTRLACGKDGTRRTVLMIAHRLSTVRNADKIVVLDAGRVVEQGTHDELLAAEGLYARMWADYGQAASWKIASHAGEVA